MLSADFQPVRKQILGLFGDRGEAQERGTYCRTSVSHTRTPFSFSLLPSSRGTKPLAQISTLIKKP